MTEARETTATTERELPVEQLVPGVLRDRMDMIQRLADYGERVRDNPGNSSLFAYQVPAFLDTVDFLRGRTLDLQDEKDLSISGYLDLPTSFGKTVIMAKLAEALGIGEPLPETGRRPRALILVPAATGVGQLIGEIREGFAIHAPGLKCTPYFGDAKDLSGDAIVMTYRSFLLCGLRGELPDVDVVLCDEAHHTLGPATRELLESYCQGKIALGLTATPEYDGTRHIEHIFKDCIHKSELLPLIKSGIVNGVQLIGLATDVVLDIKRRKNRDFNPRQLAPLVHNDERNLAIVEMAKQLIAEGRQGMINAVQSKSWEHARLLAAALNGQEVIDANGEPIIIRAEAIGNFLSFKERQKLLKEYREGKIHTLVQVKLLDEMWDETSVDFIINTSPTKSKVKATQRIGRGLRPNEDHPTTVIVEFIDDIIGNHQVVHAWQVFGCAEIKQNTIIMSDEQKARLEQQKEDGRKRHLARQALAEQQLVEFGRELIESLAGENIAEQSSKRSRPKVGAYELEKLPEVLRKKAEDFTFKVAYTVAVGEHGPYQAVKPGWVEVMDLAPLLQQKELSLYKFFLLLTELSISYETALTKNGPRLMAEARAKKALEDYVPPEYVPQGLKNISEIARDIAKKYPDQDEHTLYLMVRTAVAQLTAKGTIAPKKHYLARSVNRKLDHYDEADIAHIEREVAKRLDLLPKKDEDIVMHAALAKEVGVDKTALQFFMLRHHGIVGQERTAPRNKLPALAYRRAEADVARFHYGHEIIPKGSIMLERIAEQLHIPEEVIHVYRERSKQLAALLKKGRYSDARHDYHYTLFCTLEDYGRVAEILEDMHTAETALSVEPIPLDAYDVAAPLQKPEELPVPAPIPVEPVQRVAEPEPQHDTGVTAIASVNREPLQLIDLLREVRCNPAAASYLLRQSPYSSHHRHAATITQQEAVWLRRRCGKITAAGNSFTSDRSLAKKFQRPLSEIHAIIPSLTPAPSQIGLFRTTDGDDIITFHYSRSLTVQIEHVLRQRQNRKE